MSGEILLVLLILIGAILLFATEVVSVDLGALIVLGALLSTGLVSPSEGVSGFGNPATITVASIFEFGKLGLILFAAGFLFMLLAGPWLLPARKQGELASVYRLGEYVTELRVTDKSGLIGKSVEQANSPIS